MRDFFKWLFYDVKRDSQRNYRKRTCKLYNEKFTVIQNSYGQKVWQCYIKHCPCCGEKLDGRK
jgi:hypothetical protein